MQNLNNTDISQCVKHKEEALMIRNQNNKQLFDVVVIAYEPVQSQVILQEVDFDTASQYVIDFNKSIN